MLPDRIELRSLFCWLLILFKFSIRRCGLAEASLQLP